MAAIPGQGPDTPVGVVVFGMGSRQVNLLEMVFAGPGGSCCVVVPEERAQACIVDMDSVGAVEEVLRQRRLKPGRPMMLTGVRRPADSVVGPDLFVAKPIRVDALVAAVAVLRARVRGPLVMDPEDLPPRHRSPEPATGERSTTIVLPAITVHPAPGRERPPTVTPVADPDRPSGSGVGREAAEQTPSGPVAVPPAERRVRGVPPSANGTSPPDIRNGRSSSGTSSPDIRNGRSSNGTSSPSGVSPSAGMSGPIGASPLTGRRNGVGGGPGAPRAAGPDSSGVPVVVRPRVIRVGSAWQATGEVLPQVETVTGPDGVRMERISSYEPVRYLQGLVARARQEGLRRDRAVHLEGPWPTITLLPTCGTAVVAGGAQALRPFGPQYDLPSHGRVTFTPAPLFSPHHPDAVDLEALIWELALGASGGRVPEGTAPEGLCALKDWPNFTRLAPTPGAMSIAALWTRQAITLEETARTLQVPLKEVCSFYSAAHAVGLITTPTETAVSASVNRLVPPSPRRGLLRRVFEKLGVA